MPTIMTVTFEVAGSEAAPETTEFLANWDGADAATSFTESSLNAAAGTFGGSAQLDTAQKNSGTSSVQLTAGGLTAVSFPDIANYNIGSQDFTIEFFVRFDGLAGNQYLISQWAASPAADKAWTIYATSSSLNFIWGQSPSGISGVFGSWSPVVDTWYHVAYSKDGNDGRLFADGVQVGSTADHTSKPILNSSAPLQIGALGNQSISTVKEPMDGWMDDTRIVVGQGLYTAAFTPPTGPFPAP